MLHPDSMLCSAVTLPSHYLSRAVPAVPGADAVPPDAAAREPAAPSVREGAARGHHDPRAAGAARQLGPPHVRHGRLHQGALARLEGNVVGPSFAG